MAASTPAVAALVRAGIDHAVHAYEHEPSSASYGAEAADRLGVEAARVFKTLIAAAGTELLVAVVPVDRQVDLKALAAAIGAKRAEMADPADAQRATGYVVGGISPLGQKRRLTTVVDASASSWDTIFVSAGKRGLELELAPTDLIALTAARVAPIATAP